MSIDRLMVTRRWIVILGAIGACGLLLFLWLSAPKHRITKAGFDEIQLGMTEPEVIAILGVPPGVYISKDTELRLLLASEAHVEILNAKFWQGDAYGDCEEIWVGLDSHGQVSDKRYGNWGFRVDAWTRLRRRLGF